MKTLILFALLTIDTTRNSSTVVFVCNSSKAKKYHLHTDCRGLSNCQHKIIKLSLADAQKRGLTLCSWEK